MGQIKLTISLVMIALFSIAMIGFAINFASDNNAIVSVNQDANISSLYSNSKTSVGAFSEDGEDTYQSILETTIEGTGGTAPSTAPFAITPTNALSTTKNILQVGYEKIFGSGAGFAIFLGALVGTIALLYGLYIYKTLRGNPD